MKRILSTDFSKRYGHICLLIVRVTVSAFMLSHGIPKLSRLFGSGEVQFADPFGLGVGTSLVFAIFAEVVCSILIIIGFFTRLAALPLIFTMLVAAFYAHASDPFATKEKALLYIIIYSMLAVFGSGIYSVDNYLKPKRRRW
jgi:putative oxidoreductase